MSQRVASDIDSPGVQLVAERAAASFPVRELTYFLDGGAEQTRMRERFEAIVEAEPVFRRSCADYSLSRPERYRLAMRKQLRLCELIKDLQLTGNYATAGSDVRALRLAVHDDIGSDLQLLMFIPNLKATFSDEQLAHWLPRAEAWEVLGCYAQTELGHGSNVRALETTATYLPDTDEIEIHSPTLASTKWWPGALGRTANHAIVFARLLVAGRDLGIHNFLVQIRDLETHAPLPGVAVGDIGSKIGYNAQDNGFCRFERVRIPRVQMAMRNARLSRTGEYTTSGSVARDVLYSTMTLVRAEIVGNCGNALAKACTIAIRYSAVRRQGFADGGHETIVLDYAMQQARLLPCLVSALAFRLTATHVTAMLNAGDAAALHVASAGLKALCSRLTCEGIETCRLACGGHGYLEASGLPSLLGTFKQNATVEGENYMIAQQTTRGLLKALQAHSVGGEATAPAAGGGGAQGKLVEGEHQAFVRGAAAAATVRCEASTLEALLEPATLCAAYRQRAAWQLLYVRRALGAAAAAGAAPIAAWNGACPDIVRCSESYCFDALVRHFCAAVASLEAVGSPLAPPLRSCRSLFALWHMQQHIGEFLESGYLGAAQVELVREGVRRALLEVRRDAVPLCDAWGFSDHALNSALGRYDGDVYTALYASAQPALNPMNRDEVDPG